MNRKKELALSFAPLLWLVLFFAIPTLIIYTFAFKPSETYGGVGTGWTLDTIKSLASVSNVKLITRTLWVSLSVTFACLILALPVGYAIAKAKPKLQQLLLLLVVIPFWTSFIVRIYAWKSLLHPEGLLKSILLSMNLVSEGTVFLYNPFAVVLVMVYTYVPFAILPLYSASSKFDEHLFEAAADLGMTRLKAFFKIFIPSIRTGLLTATLLVFIPCLGAYVIPDLIGGPDSMMLGNRIVQKTFVERDIPLASALSALLSAAVLIPMSITMLLQSRHAVKGGH